LGTWIKVGVLAVVLLAFAVMATVFQLVPGAPIGGFGAGVSETTVVVSQEGCPTSGTSDIRFVAKESIAQADGTINKVGGTVTTYLQGTNTILDSSTVLDTGSSSSTDPNCGAALRSKFENSSYYQSWVDYTAADGALTQVSFSIDAIPTVAVQAKNGTGANYRSSPAVIVLGTDEATTGIWTQIQAGTARSVIYDPRVAVEYHTGNLSAPEPIGKTALPSCPSRIGAIYGTGYAVKCYDLGLGKTVANYLWSPEIQWKFAAKASVNPGNNSSGNGTVVRMVFYDMAPYDLNGEMVIGAQDAAAADVGASDATFTFLVE